MLLQWTQMLTSQISNPPLWTFFVECWVECGSTSLPWQCYGKFSSSGYVALTIYTVCWWRWRLQFIHYYYLLLPWLLLSSLHALEWVRQHVCHWHTSHTELTLLFGFSVSWRWCNICWSYSQDARASFNSYSKTMSCRSSLKCWTISSVGIGLNSGEHIPTQTSTECKDLSFAEVLNKQVCVCVCVHSFVLYALNFEIMGI